MKQYDILTLGERGRIITDIIICNNNITSGAVFDDDDHTFCRDKRELYERADARSS